MSIFGIISIIVTASIIFFAIGAVLMSRYINSKPEPQPAKMPTRETVYAAHVVNTAAQIYCNYSESKIIRPGQNNQSKKDRQGEALQEALNLVGAAYRYFDIIDSDETKKPKTGIHVADSKNIKIN